MAVRGRYTGGSSGGGGGGGLDANQVDARIRPEAQANLATLDDAQEQAARDRIEAAGVARLLDTDISTTLPRDVGEADRSLSQRAIIAGIDNSIVDGSVAWGPSTDYDAQSGTVGDDEYKRINNRTVEIQAAEANERTALLAVSAIRLGGRSYAAAVVRSGQGIAHKQAVSSVGRTDNVSSFADQGGGVIRVNTGDNRDLAVGSIVRFTGTTLNSVALTATDRFRVVAVGGSGLDRWFEIRAPHLPVGASATWELINYTAGPPDSDFTITNLEYVTGTFPLYRLTTSGTPPVKGDVLTFDGITGFPSGDHPVRARTSTTFDVWIGAAGAALAGGHGTRLSVHVHPDLPALLPDPLPVSRPDVFVSRRTVESLMSSSSQQGQGGQGQGDSPTILSNLIGAESSITLTQAQSRLTLTSPSGSAVTQRATAFSLPQTTVAGDRIRVDWAWQTKPSGPDDITRLVLKFVPAGQSALEPVRVVWDNTGGQAEWKLPAGVTGGAFEGTYTPSGVSTSTSAVIDLSAATAHFGTQAIGPYVEAIASAEASDFSRQAERRAIAHADAGDFLLHASIDNAVSTTIRRPRIVYAWIRAASETAAKAGTAAATWTNQGSGSPPTGAYWNRNDVPSGSGEIYELTSEVSPTPGSSSAWTFGAWHALQVTNTPVVNTQYSVDGSTAWHTVYVGADRYERHRDPITQAWGPAVPLYENDRLGRFWQTIYNFQAFFTTGRYQGFVGELQTQVDLSTFTFIRARVEIQNSSFVFYSKGMTLLPAFLEAAPFSEKNTGTPGWNRQATMIIGCSHDKGAYVSTYDGTTTGAANDLTDPRIACKFVRPDGSSNIYLAQYMRCYEVKSTGVRHHIAIEGL